MKFHHDLAVRFRSMPIRRKLRVIVVFTTVFALLLAGVAIIGADSILFYRSLQRDLRTIAQIIGDNSTGALAFDDSKAGMDALSALRARTHVETACLYESGGTALATYYRPGYAGECPAPDNDHQMKYSGGRLTISHPILRSGKPLGALVLRYDLDEIPERIRLYSEVVLFFLLLSCLTSLTLSSKLRALIAEPILALAKAANAVARSRDYRIRANKVSEDEVGAMTDAFNHMLDGIQSRDDDLSVALDTQRVATNRLSNLNADLKHSNAELARSNQDLERFAFIASHDLQEPLRMITTYSQLLVAERPDPSEQSKRYVRYIVDGTRHMRELLADLLAYTEIAGSTEPATEHVDLNEVLVKVQQTLGARIAETQAQINTEPLPTLVAHEGRMTSLFLNLIGNALKYRSAAPPHVRVWVGSDGDEFTFSVADNGIGIAPEFQSGIFEPFKRLHNREIPGTGIGLAICQRIVERYGGRIWVESDAGMGATFRFTLPRNMQA